MKKSLLAIVLACLFLVSAVGCSNSNSTEDKTANKEATRTVTDIKGEVTIPAEPKRIVDLSGCSDTLALLGYQVVGTCNSDAYDYTKLPSYLEDTLKDAKILGYSMSNTVNLEAVIALEPDMIIISNVQESSYDQLSEIASTVMLQFSDMDWKADFMQVAKLMNREDVAKQWLADYEAKALAIGDEVKVLIGEDATCLVILVSQENVFLFEGAGLGSFAYQDLGLARPENLPNQENVTLPVTNYEGLSKINADYLVVLGGPSDFERLESSAIWPKIPAVEKKQYLEIPQSPYFNQGYSPVGRLALLDEIRTALDSVTK